MDSWTPIKALHYTPMMQWLANDSPNHNSISFHFHIRRFCRRTVKFTLSLKNVKPNVSIYQLIIMLSTQYVHKDSSYYKFVKYVSLGTRFGMLMHSMLHAHVVCPSNTDLERSCIGRFLPMLCPGNTMVANSSFHDLSFTLAVPYLMLLPFLFMSQSNEFIDCIL